MDINFRDKHFSKKNSLDQEDLSRLSLSALDLRVVSACTDLAVSTDTLACSPFISLFSLYDHCICKLYIFMIKIIICMSALILQTWQSLRKPWPVRPSYPCSRGVNKIAPFLDFNANPSLYA